jgi:hypothetical protein
LGFAQSPHRISNEPANLAPKFSAVPEAVCSIRDIISLSAHRAMSSEETEGPNAHNSTANPQPAFAKADAYQDPRSEGLSPAPWRLYARLYNYSEEAELGAP